MSPARLEQWRAASLAALEDSLHGHGNMLLMVEGPAERALPKLAHRLSASTVFCSRDHTPPALLEEREVARALRDGGVELKAFGGQLIVEPGELTTASGRPFRVFTPFFHAWTRNLPVAEPLPEPARLPAPNGGERDVAALVRDNVRPPLTLIAPSADENAWVPGEAAALSRMQRFDETALAFYESRHDRPDLDQTSQLSPRLAWGELSPRQVVAGALRQQEREVAIPFVRQVAWREFSYHILAEFPELESQPWRPEFSEMPWRDDIDGFDAWKAGRTGFPLVDAGMRQLAETGWMHNRVRLVVASFLTKDLLLPWQLGERAFAEMLADHDPAANGFNWQWVAGSGADASPYFRVFNPVTQGGKFDPAGDYVRRWVPELRWMPPRWIHRPWDAPERELRQARVSLGVDYPRPIVDHGAARLRALASFDVVRMARRSAEG